MKTKVLSLITVFLLGTASVFAASKTEKFKVYGNCGMCEKTIEKAALSVEGVSAADWNKETKQMEVTFDDSKTDVHKVHAAIAKAGYDTDMHKASDEAYNKLHSCCQYERAPEKPVKE
ncbi:cation transporter [Mangrovibacterium marinum]|uniref:heavy-metal-associated domain-containing protein n=1 Tax=Mangrovibacterium marinum TaxID=1639118 RepID=UPI002A18AB8E|nr:cation transporter [Mangrovibacterium marinum]